MVDSRKKYHLTVGGVKHTMLLTPQDAERYGEAAVEAKEAKAPANKARSATRNKATTPEADTTAQATTAN